MALITALATYGHQDAVPLLAGELGAVDAWVRLAALDALDIMDRRLTDPVGAFVEDVVQHQAAWKAGLRPGDGWCLCAARWQEALEADCAPRVFLASTHEQALDTCSFDDLRAHALDVN